MRWLCILLVAVVCCVGCQSGSMNPFGSSSSSQAVSSGGTGYGTADLPDMGIPPSAQQRFSDVPLPVGARLDADKTMVIETSEVAAGRLVYQTRSSTSDLAQFYMQECPANGWELVSTVQAGATELMFRKPGKRLSVKVSDRGMGRGRELTLTLLPER